MKNAALTLLSLFITYTGFTQTDDYLCYPKDPKARFREHNYDMIKGVIEVNFNSKEGVVNGKVTYDFAAKQQKVDTIYLDAPNISFSSILLDNKSIKYKQ